MFLESFIYLIFSLSSMIFSLFVILSKNPIHSVLSLIFVFFNTSVLLFFLGAEFLAMLLIIVYVGAVAVLFLFVIMLLNTKIYDLSSSIYRYFPVFFLFFGVLFFELTPAFHFNLVNLWFLSFPHLLASFELTFSVFWNSFSVFHSNVYSLGFILYTYYLYHFIISGIILLVSMLGAISLTLHRRNDVKRQFIYKQVQKNFVNTIFWKN